MHQMKLGILLLVMSIAITSSEGILCYRCTSTREPRIPGILLCSEFDWSKRYEVSCNTSTFCLRKNYTTSIGDEKIQRIELGCAPQQKEIRNWDQKTKTWFNDIEIVNGVYKEGCSLGEDTGSPGGRAEYCYCDYDLCNGSDSLTKISYSITVVQIMAVVFNALANYS